MPGKGKIWRPRIIFDVDEELYLRAFHYIPWGMRSVVLGNILRRLVEKAEKEGPGIVYLLAHDKVDIFGAIKGMREILDILSGEEKKDN
jgi:hypothetical protein